MSILDTAFHIGAESVYGTFLSLTRSYEAKSDPWKRKQSYLESVGFRAGLQAVRSDRRQAINMGAEGSIELDLMNIGMGLLLRDAFGLTTGPTLVSGTTRDTVFSTTKDGPSTSFSAQMIRPFVDGSSQPFTYKGCVVTGWELNAEAADGENGFLRWKEDIDSQTEDTSVGAGTAVYPASQVPFNWTMVSTSTVGGTPIDFKKLAVKADYKANTDRRFLKTGGLRKQPRIGGVPEYTGELEAEFASLAEYTRFVTGAVVAGQWVWTGAQIDSSPQTFFTATLDIAALQYTGDAPAASLTELPKQPLPFAILDNGSLPAVKLTLRSSDAAL